jgi:catechol 2,3-dioxygenase-like lactoylglutathione lyase family enzyme
MMVEDPSGNWLELVQNTTNATAGTGLDLTKDSIDLGIMVTDADKSLAFYRDLLGLTPDPDMAELPMPDGSVMHRLFAGTSLIKVRQHAKGPVPAAVPGGTDTATGLRYWTMTVDNLAEVTKKCADAGCPVPLSPVEIRPGTSISMVEDPDGNWVELLEVKPAASL